MPWATVLPWLVVALMFFGDGYHRIMSGEERLTENQVAIRHIEQAVAELRSEIQTLKAIVDRVDAQTTSEMQRRLNSRVR